MSKEEELSLLPNNLLEQYNRLEIVDSGDTVLSNYPKVIDVREIETGSNPTIKHDLATILLGHPDSYNPYSDVLIELTMTKPDQSIDKGNIVIANKGDRACSILFDDRLMAITEGINQEDIYWEDTDAKVFAKWVAFNFTRKSNGEPENLLKNASFEDITQEAYYSTANDWQPALVTDTTFTDGKYSGMPMSYAQGGGIKHRAQQYNIEDFTSGRKYVSIKYRPLAIDVDYTLLVIVDYNAGWYHNIRVKSGEVTSYKSVSDYKIEDLDDGWKQLTFSILIPEGKDSIHFGIYYFRGFLDEIYLGKEKR